VQRVFTSPLNRARQTAAIVFPDRALEVDERINNIDLGVWSAWPRRRSPPANRTLEQWRRAPEHMRFPGGETLETFTAAVAQFLLRVPAAAEERLGWSRTARCSK